MDQQEQPKKKNRRPPAPHFLAPNGRGHVTRPLRPYPEHADPDELALEAEEVKDATRFCDEPEMIGPAIVDAYGESAWFYKSLQHQADVEAAQQARKFLTAEQRLADVQSRAKRKQVADLKPEFQAMRAMLDRARRGGRQDPPAVTRKLERIEAKLDGLGFAA